MARPTPSTSAHGQVNGSVTVTFSFTSTGLPLIVQGGIGVSDAPTRAALYAKYNGVSMTQLGSLADDGNFECAGIWYMLSPPVGTFTVTVGNTLLNAAQTGAGAQEWTNFGSFGTPQTFGTNSGNSISGSSLTPSSNDVLLGALATDDGGGANTFAPSGTALWEENNVGSGDSTFQAAYINGAGSVITPTWSGLNANGGAGCAVIIVGTGGGGATVGGPVFDGRTFRGLTFGRTLGSPMQRQHALWQEAARLQQRNMSLRRAA